MFTYLAQAAKASETIVDTSALEAARAKQELLLTTQAEPALLPANVAMALAIAAVAMTVIGALSLWRIFTKAGKPGWAALVPIYNAVVLIKIAGRPWWWIFLMFIPLVNLILGVLVLVELAERFGKSVSFGGVLVLLPVIGFPVLAFGRSKYQPAGEDEPEHPADAPAPSNDTPQTYANPAAPQQQWQQQPIPQQPSHQQPAPRQPAFQQPGLHQSAAQPYHQPQQHQQPMHQPATQPQPQTATQQHHDSQFATHQVPQYAQHQAQQHEQHHNNQHHASHHTQHHNPQQVHHQAVHPSQHHAPSPTHIAMQPAAAQLAEPQAQPQQTYRPRPMVAPSPRSFR